MIRGLSLWVGALSTACHQVTAWQFPYSRFCSGLMRVNAALVQVFGVWEVSLHSNMWHILGPLGLHAMDR